jgi:hypothetical protein
MENIHGVTTCDPILVSIQEEAPSFLVPPAGVRADIGGDGVFSCEFIGFPVPAVSWLKDGATIPDAFERQFRIANVQASDVGLYQCVLTNRVGTCMSTAVPLELTGQLPQFVTEPVSTAGVIGNAVTLDVSVIGIPLPTVAWYCNGVKLPDQTGTQVRMLCCLDVVIVETHGAVFGGGIS